MRIALVPAFLLASVLSFGQGSELNRLRAEAEAKTKEIGKLAQSGKLPTNDEALKLLQQMVQELADIRERLKKLESAQTAGPTTPLGGHFRWSGYMQYQYQDTDRIGSSTFDAFRFRRVRLSFEDDVSPRLSARVSFDLAAGANQTQAQIRDAWALWDASGGSKPKRDRVWAGQMPFQLGYELDRSSQDRELPERAQYNQILFPTERSRGVRIRHDGRDGSVGAGLYNSLTMSDPEQVNLASGPGNKLVTNLTARWNHSHGTVGVSGLFGERPAYTANNATSPETPRRYGYLDGEYRGFLTPRLTLRGEWMTGRDRVPNTTASPDRVDHELAGYHLAAIYQLSNMDRLAVRWEHFDPDLDRGGNALHGIGASFLHDISTQARLMFAHEIFVDQARSSLGQTRYGITTLRFQVRF